MSDADILPEMTGHDSQSDLDLLRLYATAGSQPAFTALVQRHINLVYSAALRQIRSPQLAEEITQSVFTDLARNAAKLTTAPGGAPVTAWLYQVARRTAIDVIRQESRRQLREQIALEMNAMNATAAEWSCIAPLLDDAMAALAETDRTAILLRYFENKSLAEVGAALGTSDDTAQKRVSRAVDQLRDFFAKRKITTTATALSVIISANAVQAAPAGLAATISASGLITATKTAAMTALQKILVTTAFVIVSGVAIYQAQIAAHLRDQVRSLSQQQSTLTGRLRQLQSENNALTSRLAEFNPQQLRQEHLELLSLRGRATLLANELRKEATPAHDNSSPQAGAPSDDSILLTSASTTNLITSSNTFIVGGWSLLNKRAYVLITPAIVTDGSAPENLKINLQGQIIQAPETFWNAIGWEAYKSGTHRSTLSGELTPDQTTLLLQALRATKDAEISVTPAETVPAGTRRGYGFARQEDDGTGGALIGVDFYPRIAPDGRSISLEIIPSPVSSTTPIHPALTAEK